MSNPDGASQNVPLYSAREFADRVERARTTVEVDGEVFKCGLVTQVLGVKRGSFNGAEVLILYQREDNGAEFGVVLDRKFAKQLTRMLGPHPLVEQFFRLH